MAISIWEYPSNGASHEGERTPAIIAAQSPRAIHSVLSATPEQSTALNGPSKPAGYGGTEDSSRQ